MTFPTASFRFEGPQNDWRLDPLEGDSRLSSPSIEFLDDDSSDSEVERQLTWRSDYTLRPVTIWHPRLPVIPDSVPLRVRRKARVWLSPPSWMETYPVYPPIVQVTIPEATSSETACTSSRSRKRSPAKKKTASNKKVSVAIPKQAEQSIPSTLKRSREGSQEASPQGSGSSGPSPKRQRVTRSTVSSLQDSNGGSSDSPISSEDTSSSTPDLAPGHSSEDSEKTMVGRIAPVRLKLKIASTSSSTRRSRDSLSTSTRRSSRIGKSASPHPEQSAI